MEAFRKCLCFANRQETVSVSGSHVKASSSYITRTAENTTSCENLKTPASTQSVRSLGRFKFGYDSGLEEKYFVRRKVLGQGSFGTVYLGQNRHTGELVAVKTIDKRSVETEMERRDLRMEVDVLRRIGNGSLNCIALLDAFEDENCVYLVLEYASGGTLLQRLKRKVYYSESEVVRVARFVLQTIAQCHAKNIVYRDVKLENFVYLTPSKDSILKAIDFGLAVHHPQGSKNITDTSGSPYFMAPEVIKQDYSFECDLWSMGVLVYMLLCGRKPFTGNPRLARKEQFFRSLFQDIQTKPIKLIGPEWESVSSSAKAFLERLLERDPRKRMTVPEAFKHPWLSDEGTGASSTLAEDNIASAFNNSIMARLQRFSTYDLFKKTALTRIVREHSKPKSCDGEDVLQVNRTRSSKMMADYIQENEESQRLLRLFKLMDTDDKGVVSLQDAKACLFQSDYDVSDSELQKIWCSISHSSSGDENSLVDISDFMTALLDWNKLVNHLSQKGGCVNDLYKQVFDFFDSETKGFLTSADVARALSKNTNSSEVVSLFTVMDTENQGKITFSNFEKAMKDNENDILSIYDARLQKKPVAEITASESADLVDSSRTLDNIEEVSIGNMSLDIHSPSKSLN